MVCLIAPGKVGTQSCISFWFSILSDTGGEFGDDFLTRPQGRDKSGPYGLGIASLASQGQFSTSILSGDS